MSADAAPLAVLLASHPEECAAVLCALCAVDSEGEEIESIEHYVHVWGGVDPGRDAIRGILQALESADIAEMLCPRQWTLIDMSHRYAIARMGAAAWLRERVAQP